MGKLALVSLVIAALGCSRTFSRGAVQPNPLVVADPTARTSERITIVRNDVDLLVPVDRVGERDPSARPVTQNGQDCVSRPMVNHQARESVGAYYQWPLQTSASWTMISRDDLRFHVAIDHKWLDCVDLAKWRAQLIDDQGHVYAPKSIEHRRAHILYGHGDDEAALTIYRGNGDLVFEAAGLLSPDARWIKLVIDHGVDRFEYTWKFESDVAAR